MQESSTAHPWRHMRHPPQKCCGSTPAGGRSAGVAVRVAGSVAALQPGLMHPQPTEIVAVWEESDIRDKTARGDIGVELGHPCADAVGVEHLVPCRIQRVRDIYPAAVSADLDHLGATAER